MKAIVLLLFLSPCFAHALTPTPSPTVTPLTVHVDNSNIVLERHEMTGVLEEGASPFQTPDNAYRMDLVVKNAVNQKTFCEIAGRIQVLKAKGDLGYFYNLDIIDDMLLLKGGSVTYTLIWWTLP